MIQCKSTYCSRKNRGRRPVWAIDGQPYCNPCFEEWMESHFVDQHSVHRLSELESDFESNWRPARRNSHRVLA